ncbi:MAG: carboxypeptidase regulatory-like domain-containing protein, partial [Gammaproteobacteria bacterium]
MEVSYRVGEDWKIARGSGSRKQRVHPTNSFRVRLSAARAVEASFCDTTLSVFNRRLEFRGITRFCARPLGIVSLLASAAIAQVTTGTINGIVVDESGGLVPGAEVALVSEDRGGVTRKTTDQSGEFVFNFVPVGRYTVTISKPGFTTQRATALEVQSAQTIRQTFALKIGQTADSVSVTAEASLLNSASAEQRESFQEIAVRELPLARRNFSQILSQGAGIVAAGNGKFNLNGLGGAGTRITVDGTEASADARASGTAMFSGFNRIDLLSLEAIQEVQVVKGVIPAEYGQSLGGNINVITRSGTNQYHGTLFYNYQGTAIAARHQFLQSKPNFVRNQFGGSAGGPILKDRLFLFTAYEGYRESNFQFLSADVPTQGLRDRILAAPAWRSLPETRIVLDQFPLPNVPHHPNDSSAQWRGPGSSTSRDDHLDVKGDMRIGAGGSLSATYTRGRPENRIPRVHPVNFRIFEGKQDRVTSSFVWGAPKWTS